VCWGDDGNRPGASFLVDLGLGIAAAGFVHVAGAHTWADHQNAEAANQSVRFSAAAEFDGDGTVDAAFGHGGDLRGKAIYRGYFAAAIGRADAKTRGWEIALFGGGVLAGRIFYQGSAPERR